MTYEEAKKYFHTSTPVYIRDNEIPWDWLNVVGAHYPIGDLKLSEENNKLIIIQKSVLKDSENQVIIVNFDLKTGDRKEIFKIN